MGKVKKSKNNPDIRNQSQPQIGKKVRFIKLKNAELRCTACGRLFSSEMISEYNRKYYCDEECIQTEVNG